MCGFIILSFYQYNQLHLVGFDSDNNAINTDIADSIDSICWHDNVYVALAEIILSSEYIRTNNHSLDFPTVPCSDPFPTRILVCVLIDGLDEKQMNIFECLAKLDCVDSLAISSINDYKKLQFATRFGTIRCLEKDQIFQVHHSVDVAKSKIIIKEYPVRTTGRNRRKVAANQWLKSNVVKGRIFQEITEPTLTQKELNDLLG